MLDARAALLLLLVASPAHHGLAEEPATEPLELAAVQAMADAAYEAGRYAEAYEIYFDDLTPAGDKYAQYMIGVMHLHGLGRPADAPLGAAWIALAAERGEPELEAAREEILAKLSDQELQIQQTLLSDLRSRFGDCALVAQALAEARDEVGASTGSRLATGIAGPVSVLLDQADEDGRLTQRELRKLIRQRERFLRDNCP